MMVSDKESYQDLLNEIQEMLSEDLERKVPKTEIIREAVAYYFDYLTEDGKKDKKPLKYY